MEEEKKKEPLVVNDLAPMKALIIGIVILCFTLVSLQLLSYKECVNSCNEYYAPCRGTIYSMPEFNHSDNPNATLNFHTLEGEINR